MRAASIVALAFVLAGCTSSHERPKNMAVFTSPSEAVALASDALGELVKLYPPAITRLSIAAPAAGDTFGQALADGLRKHGYAVVETAGQEKPDPSALPLRYVLDQPVDSGFYRVMLTIAGQSLSRGYVVAQAGVSSSAGWALDLSGASPELIERATRPDLPPDAEQASAELAAVSAGVAPQSALVADRTDGPALSSSGPASIVTVPIPPPPASYAAQQAVDAHKAELVAADAQVQRMTTKLAEYQAADTLVRHMSAKVASDQAALARAKARRSATAAGWRVQFAAFHTDRTAHTYWRRLVTARPSLATLKPRFPHSTHGMTFVQVGPYRTVAFARTVCGGLHATACIVVKA